MRILGRKVRRKTIEKGILIVAMSALLLSGIVPFLGTILK